MSLPPVPDAHDEVDDRYRRASALDPSRPDEAVRRRVLEHAAQLAALRRGTLESSPRRPAPRWRPAAMIGTLAAAVVAGLMIAPRFLVPPMPPQRAPSAPPALALEKPVPPPAPVVASAPAATAFADARARAPQAASPQVAQSLQGRREAYSAAAHSGQAAHPGSAAADVAAAANSADTGVTAEQVTVTAARRAVLAPPVAKNVTDGAAAFRHAAETGDLGALDRLLPIQSDINARDVAGRTPLMLAILRGRTEVVSALLAYGADPNAADTQGTTPLQAARTAGRPAVIAALQRYGAR